MQGGAHAVPTGGKIRLRDPIEVVEQPDGGHALAQGRSNDGIADLFVSRTTVKSHATRGAGQVRRPRPGAGGRARL